MKIVIIFLIFFILNIKSVYGDAQDDWIDQQENLKEQQESGMLNDEAHKYWLATKAGFSSCWEEINDLYDAVNSACEKKDTSNLQLFRQRAQILNQKIENSTANNVDPNKSFIEKLNDAGKKDEGLNRNWEIYDYYSKAADLIMQKIDTLAQMVGETLNDPTANEDADKNYKDTQADLISKYEQETQSKVASLTGPTYAKVDIEQSSIGSPVDDPGNYNPENDVGDTGRIITVASTILKAIRLIGVIFSVIALMIYGVRYMFGSLEERAEYKETLVPWLVGCLFLTVGITIVEYIYSIASTF